MFDRLTEIRQSQSRQLQARIRRSEEFAGHLLPRVDGDRRRSRRSPPASTNSTTPRSTQRNSSRSSTTTPTRSPRTRRRRPVRQRRRRCAAADLATRRNTCRPTTPPPSATSTTRADWDSTFDDARRRQRVVGRQRPLQRLLPRDRHALRVRGRAAARHPRQRRLHRLQGRRPRHQHPQRAVQGQRAQRRLPEGAGRPTPSTTSGSPTSATISPPTSRPRGWCRRSARRAASTACWRCSSRSPRSTG